MFTTALFLRTMRFILFAPVLSLSLLIGSGVLRPGWAGTGPILLSQATTVPAELQTLVQGLDTAASAGQLDQVLAFFADDFSGSDGLSRDILEQSLSQLWETYNQLTYRTTIDRWQRLGNGWEVEVTTKISGTGSSGDRPLALEATLRAKQTMVDGKITGQEILGEQTRVSTGTAPPTIEFSLPEQVRPGQEYHLDAIVQEPIGDSILLGSASEEAITPESYLNPSPLRLELLNAGGIFKIGRAPSQPGNRWVSVALIRDTGMVFITQRLRVATP